MHLEEYRKLAEVEDRMWYFRALNRRVAHWLARLLPTGTARVLDAGCGTGGLIRTLRAAHPEWCVEGLDFMPLACALARERTGTAITQGSITAMPFADAAFDAIATCDVVCQVDDAAGAIDELARCVRPGGTVVVNAPAYAWLWSYHDEAVQSKHRFTRPELTAHFRTAGLEVVFASYANSLILPLVAARRKLLPPRSQASDVALSSAPVESALAALAALEFAWQRRGLASPAGSSVFIVGRRA
ncbi:MAG: class I SAM-dependent methyltransferase [Opitutaceae bacterium]|nr:class I SAM-dependent methyltransferase [Opitutaceae bacterium]